jgi:hypothetical protein
MQRFISETIFFCKGSDHTVEILQGDAMYITQAKACGYWKNAFTP